MAATNCIFCKIICGEAPATILFQNPELIVFKDIKPVAKNHYLVVPKQHIANVKYLTTEDDRALVERMKETGLNILKENEGNENDVRIGFHCPPFNSVGHLHLHVISPASEMGFYNKFVFKPNTYWFQSVEETLKHLTNKL